ncbi:hypothetical protein PLESTB_000730800 [Pleodorina starrii]|uniref:Ankyrin repeat domain-containing protein n=1 Tax=Pleodorina starrii TaxID=330485 RepID=A0A9W6F2F1_9CHLO|nr:hypothetical protein PLESTM_000193100 [Pleodorina starrii]GLC53310.1 hypothetical protein PLESTB_000730800 [Pleodorina starrii]
MKPVCRILVSLVVGLASLPYSLVRRALRARSVLHLRGTCRIGLKRQPSHEREQKPKKPGIVTIPARIWPQLQSELAEHIASFLPCNEVASFRMVNRAAAGLFSKPQHKRIRLSLPVPRHLFVHRWGGPNATRQLTLEERIKLLCLTAATGVLDNLKLLYSRPEFAVCTTEVFAAAAEAGRLCVCRWLRRVDCPWGEDVAEAAARAGHLNVCKWLIKQGCPHQLRRLLTVAAGAGHAELCEWLLDAGAPLSGRGPRAAARSGHVTLMERFLRPLAREHVGVPKLLAAVAEGCDLPTLQQVHRTFLETAGRGRGGGGGGAGDFVVGVGRLGETAAARVLAAAAGSSTPDWQAKVEWLRNRGYPRDASACESAVDGAAAASDTASRSSQPHPSQASNCDVGRDRLVWLRQQHGFPVGPWVAVAAARAGDVGALRLVLDAGVDPSDGRAAYAAAERGHLDVLQALHAHGRDGADAGAGAALNAEELSEAAARCGHLATLEWLVEAVDAPLSGRLFSAGAQSGSMEVMAWLRRRHCPADANTFAWCAWVGCTEQLEWLVANGCPMGYDGEAYLWAGYNGDYAVLDCLRRLGCPWAPDGSTFSRAVCLAGDEEPGHSGDMGWCCSLEVLQWLLGQGCPVDWPAAERVARLRREGEAELLDWVLQQRRRWEEEEEEEQRKKAGRAAAEGAGAAAAPMEGQAQAEAATQTEAEAAGQPAV